MFGKKEGYCPNAHRMEVVTDGFIIGVLNEYPVPPPFMCKVLIVIFISYPFPHMLLFFLL